MPLTDAMLLVKGIGGSSQGLSKRAVLVQVLVRVEGSIPPRMSFIARTLCAPRQRGRPFIVVGSALSLTTARA